MKVRRAVAVLAACAAVCSVALPGCMSSFADDQAVGAHPGWIAEWMLQAFDNGAETLLDVHCKTNVRVTKEPGARWVEVEHTVEFSVDSVYKHVKAHPKWDWFDHLTAFEGAAALLTEAHFAVEAVEMVKELVDDGHDLNQFEYMAEGTRCRAKSRRDPPRPPSGPGTCPLTEDGCPENPDSDWPWKDPPPDEPSPVPGEGDWP